MAKALRIAIALPGLHRVARGAETALERIAFELGRQGHSVTVFGSGPAKTDTPYQYRQIRCRPREKFERFPRLPALRNHYAWEELTFAPGLWRAFKPTHFDVTIGCSYPYTNWILRRGGVKHVFVTQNGDWMARARNAEFRFFNCDGLVCTNEQFFERHRERFDCALIPNGVDPEVFQPGTGNREEFGLPGNQPVTLMVSALIPSKRVTEGVRAVAGVEGMFLVIAGDGECRQEVDAEANRLLPGRYRRLTLPREKMPELYRCADVFLHTSRDEPSANAYMEALSSGLPIVTHDWEVTRWTLEDCAILVDMADDGAVTSALRRALEARSEEDVARRRHLVARRFAWSLIGEQYSSFLRHVVGQEEPIARATNILKDVGIVAIGRNEGERLKRCLESAGGGTAALVYVDSGSTDGSVAAAKNAGAEVVELDPSIPFTAARGRNAGLERLTQIAPGVNLVQFVDGDCEIRAGWLAKAAQALQQDTKLAGVCGRRRERFASATIYNQLADIEWDTPVGPAKSCGGDAMYRVEALRMVGGFDPSVAAGEEPELCLRLRHAAWKFRRINAEMTWHDSAMTRFGQWWRRQVRSGYGALDVYSRLAVNGERLFGKSTHSAVIWTIGWTIAVLASISIAMMGAWTVGWICVGLITAAWPMQAARLTWSMLGRGRGIKASIAYGFFTMLGKWGWLAGQMRYRRDRAAGKLARMIEYKQPGTPTGPAAPSGPVTETTGIAGAAR